MSADFEARLTGALTAFDMAVMFMEDRSDRYWLDALELGLRVADCQETHSHDITIPYIEYWTELATLEAQFKL